MYGWSINVAPGSDSKRDSQEEYAEVYGLFAGTKVATSDGWRDVKGLKAGERVWTFDNGLQPIAEVKIRTFRSGDQSSKMNTFPVMIPAGTLANEEDLAFLPRAGLMLECENASDSLGDPFAVMPVETLVGICGIEQETKPRNLVLVTLILDFEEVVYVDSGLLVHCPAKAFDRARDESNYDLKTLAESKELLTDLDLAELALREPYEDFFGERTADRVA